MFFVINITSTDFSTDGRGMGHVWEKENVHTGFWWRSLSAKCHLEHLGADGRIILKWILNPLGGRRLD